MALPAVSEVFKGSIDESLKTLVQPAGVVPASVLVLANIALIYPRLLAADVPAAKGFEGLDDPWKAVFISGLILVVGYVILNLNGSAMRLATGELLGGTPIGQFLSWLEARRIKSIARRAESTGQLKADNARLPPPGDAAPTRLGNVFAGSNHSLYKRYGFDMAAMWAHLEALVAKEDEDLSTALDEEYKGIQVLVNLAVTALIIGAEAIVFTLVLRAGELGLLAVVSMPIAYGLYRAAAARTRGYTDLVEVAVDLYRSKVAEKFAIKVTDSPEKDRPAWVSLRSWLLWDTRDDPAVDLETPLEVTVTASGNATVAALPARMAVEPRRAEGVGRARATWQEDYAFLLSAKLPAECCDQDAEVTLALSAGKEWVLDPEPTVDLGGRIHSTKVLKGGAEGDSLLISTALKGNSSGYVLVSYPRMRAELVVAPRKGRHKFGVAFAGSWPLELGAKSLEFRIVPTPVIKAKESIPVTLSFVSGWMTANAVITRLNGATVPGAMKDGRWVVDADLAGEATFRVDLLKKPPRKDKPEE